MDLTKLIKTKRDDSGPGHRLHITLASAELAPFSKTGGLADVAASLPKALAERGHRVSIVTPLYRHLDPDALRFARRLTPLEVPRKAKSQKKIEATVWERRIFPGATAFFIECDEYFDRESLYGYDGGSYDDNADRFAFFSRAIVEFARQMSVPCDILHFNDWHTALGPIYLDQYYGDELDDVATVLTVHNAAYQGVFEEDSLAATGLPAGTFASENELLLDGSVNFLKGGLVHADKITTVSPTYAEEIQQEETAFGLHEVLSSRSDDLHGILNGADYSVWSPDHDTYISVRYDKERLNGKRRNKAELQHTMGLPVRPVLPLLSFIGRLTEQKGLDLLLPALRHQLEQIEDERDGFQVVLLGEGEDDYEQEIRQLAEDFPRRVAAHVGYNDEKAHRMLAGADMLIVPSRFEPCGLTQLYAMRYATLPIVHKTGGLADTVRDADTENGTGFVFESFDEDALSSCIGRAVERYGHHRQWRPLMAKAMSQDFSWERSAERYEEVYLEALETTNA